VPEDVNPKEKPQGPRTRGSLEKRRSPGKEEGPRRRGKKIPRPTGPWPPSGEKYPGKKGGAGDKSPPQNALKEKTKEGGEIGKKKNPLPSSGTNFQEKRFKFDRKEQKKGKKFPPLP